MVYQQVQRLEKIVKDSESGLGSASSQINSLKDASHRLKSELEKTREELRTSKTNAANLKVSSSVDINCVKIWKEWIHKTRTKHMNFLQCKKKEWPQKLTKRIFSNLNIWNLFEIMRWVRCLCVNCLQVELDKLQNLYDAKMIEAQAELKTKLEKLSVDLESKWSETLK